MSGWCSVKIQGDAKHVDTTSKSVIVTIAENDKTAIDIAKLVNENLNVTEQQIKEAIDALKVAIEKARENSREVIVDKESGVSIETSDGTAIPTNINLRVEVKANVKAEKGSAEYKAIYKMLEGNEKISQVFDLKLIKTVDGVETEIQPSEIKEGMKLIVHIAIPEGVDTNKLRLLHIHSESDIEFVENVQVEGNDIVFEISRLSEIAFVTKSNSASMPVWAIILIVLGSLILLLGLCYLALFFLFNKWIKKDDKAVRAFKFGKKDNQVRLLVMPFRFEYRPENEVYNSKEDALK